MKQTPYIRAKRREMRDCNYLHYIDCKPTKKLIRLNAKMQVVTIEIKI